MTIATIATQAETTAARLQQAARDGRPMMIPGARDVPLHPASDSPAKATPEPRTPGGPGAGVDDRARREREREGGGAPDERLRERRRADGFWHRLFHRGA